MSRTIIGSGVPASLNLGVDGVAPIPRHHGQTTGEFSAPLRSSRRSVVPVRERSRCDEATFDRLATAGSSMRRGRQVVLVDQEVEVGRTFALSSLPEHIVFSRTAAQRAKAIALSFDAFLEVQPQPRARQWVLRSDQGPVRPDDVADAIRHLSACYDDAMKRLVASYRVAPLLATLHLRWMPDVQAFDLHIHCLWNSPTKDVTGIHAFLATRFGSVWHADEVARNVGAAANYDVFGVIDHAELASWPSDALLAVSRLTRIRFHRPAGAFAAFRSGLVSQGVRLRRGRHGIERVEIMRRPARRVATEEVATTETGTFRGLRRIRLDGRLRVCAVHVLPDQCVVDEVAPSPSHGGPVASLSVEDTNPVSTPRRSDRPAPLQEEGAASQVVWRQDSKPTSEREMHEPVPPPAVITSCTEAGSPGRVGHEQQIEAHNQLFPGWWESLRTLLLVGLVVVGLAWGVLWRVWGQPSPSRSRHSTLDTLTCKVTPRLTTWPDVPRAAGRSRLHPPIRADP